MLFSPTLAAGVSAWAIVLLAGGVPQQPRATLPQSVLPLTLTGLMLDTDAPAKSACLIRCTRPPERHGMLVAGDRACEVAEILEVRQDGVVIENLETGRTEFLTFSAATTSPAARKGPSMACRRLHVRTSQPGLPEVPVGRYLANLPELLESALATPRYRDDANGQGSSTASRSDR